MVNKEDLDPRTWCIWNLYTAILSFFSMATGNTICISPTFIDRKTFALDKDGEVPVISGSDYDRVLTALDSLPERERAVLVLRFGLCDGVPRSLEAIGRLSGVTRERIRQLEARALRKMRTTDHLCKLPALFGFVPPIEPESECVSEDTVIDVDTDIRALDLSARAYNCLRQFTCINVVGDILNYPKEDWPKVKNLGQKATLEIQEKMRAVGYPEFSIS